MDNRSDELRAIFADVAIAAMAEATARVVCRFRDHILGDIEDFTARTDTSEDNVTAARRLRGARAQVLESLAYSPDDPDALFLDVVFGLVEREHEDVIALLVAYLDGHTGERAARAAQLEHGAHVEAMIALARLVQAADRAVTEATHRG